MSLYQTRNTQALLAVASTLLAGCGEQPSAAPERTQTSVRESSTTEVSLSEVLHAQDALQLALEKSQFSGTVVYGDSCGIRYDRERGLTLSDEPITTETLFPIASISKSITALTLLRLVDKGVFSLDDTLGDHEAIFFENGISISREARAISLRHLLQHTSGLPGNIPLGIDPEDRAAMLSAMLSEELRFDPGQRYSYSNRGYVVLAAFAELITERAFPEIVDELVFEPLAQSNIFSYGVPEFDIYSSALRDKSAASSFEHPLSWGRMGCTGYMASAPSLLSLMSSAITEGFLSESTLEELLRTNEWGRGLGVAVSLLPNGDRVLAHSGAERGDIYTHFVTNLETKEGVVLFSNNGPISPAVFQNSTISLCGDELVTNTSALYRYEGEFLSDAHETVSFKVVELEDGALVLRVSTNDSSIASQLNFAGNEVAHNVAQSLSEQVSTVLAIRTLDTLCSAYAANKLQAYDLDENAQVVGTGFTPKGNAFETRVVTSAGETLSFLWQRPVQSGAYHIEAISTPERIWKKESEEHVRNLAVRDFSLATSSALYSFDPNTHTPDIKLEMDVEDGERSLRVISSAISQRLKSSTSPIQTSLVVEFP